MIFPHFRQKMCEEEYSKRAKNHKKYHMGLVTRVGAEKSLESVSDQLFRNFYPVPPKESNSPLTWKVVLKHDSCFLAGRYNKYSRELPQTPWILDGKKIFESSVEESIASKLKENLQFDGKLKNYVKLHLRKVLNFGLFFRLQIRILRKRGRGR